jgi:hypothetical protein
MTPLFQPKPADIISDFRGIYARIAHQLNGSASMAGRVADGNRASKEIESALHEELKALKDKLNKYF